jgi:DNA polymerase-3 subunit alpha
MKMKWNKIKKISECGKSQTYDIAMKSPHNNFIANDIIVHNSNVASKVCNQVDPDNFSELCDISALIRPGTLSMGVPEMYSDRKKGRPDENDHVWAIDDVPQSIRDIIKPTYGLLIFQEQLMKIAEYAANFTKGETNMLRRLIVKFGKLGIDDPKFIKNIKYYYDKFIENASRPADQGGLGGKLEAAEMWDLMVAFAGYSFNRCISFDEKVQDKVRGEITLQEVETLILENENVKVKSADENGNDIWVEVLDVHNNGEKELVEVEMEDGRKIKCTLDHKFRTPKGMLALEEIISLDLDIIMEE